MHAYRAGEFLDDLVGAVEFAHVVAIDHVERAVLVAADKFVRERTRESGDNNAGAGTEVLVVIVEDLMGRKVVEHLESGAAGREFQVAVAPVASAGVERAVAGDGDDLVAESCGESTSPDRAQAAASAAVAAFVPRSIEDRNLLLN